MDDGRLSFLGRRLEPAFVVRLITLPPSRQRRYVEEEWSDTLVVVERGAVELESLSGTPRIFVSGDVLWLDRLSLRALRNRGRVPVLLSAVSRSSTSSGLTPRRVEGDRCLFPEPGSKQERTREVP
jgi:hypothetical protein